MKFSHWNTAITSRPEWRAICKTVCTKYDPFVFWNFEPLHVMRGGGTSVHIPSRTWFPSAGKVFEPLITDQTLFAKQTTHCGTCLPTTSQVEELFQMAVGNCTRIFDSSTDGIQLNNDDVIEHATARNIVGALHTTTGQPLLTKSDHLSCCIEFSNFAPMVCAFQHLGMPNPLGWSLLHSASASGRLGGSRDVLVIEASANFRVQMFFQVGVIPPDWRAIHT